MHTALLTPPTTPQGQTVWQPITIETGSCLGHPPSYVQIDAPQRIPLKLRLPFEAGRAGILLVIAASQERVPAMVATIGETSLIADTDVSTLWRKPGEKVLAIFPAPRQSYVVQTVIEAVAVQQLTLRYQDPRYDVRRHVPLAFAWSLRRRSRRSSAARCAWCGGSASRQREQGTVKSSSIGCNTGRRPTRRQRSLALRTPRL
jgi:hypothetical protein